MNFRTQQQGRATDIVAYTYDAAGRLIGSQHGEQAHRYSVDAAGNRLASPAQQALPDNRLTQLDDARYRYDGAGNLIQRQQPDGERLTMGYDGANRLVHLTHASASGETRDATYRYDGPGRRISKTVRHPDGTTATTHYGWDGDRIVREETDQQRTTVVYEPGSFVPMLRIEDTPQGQRLSAYVTDALGTPTQLVNAHGETARQAQPHDWAATRNERGHTAQPIRFRGQWHDEESGLYYNRHRYYDPQQERYISQDPIGLNGGMNLYGYVTNPTGMVDPLGLRGSRSSTVLTPNYSLGRNANINDTETLWDRIGGALGDLKCHLLGNCLPDDFRMCTRAIYNNDFGLGEINYLDNSSSKWIPLDVQAYPPSPSNIPEGLECTESIIRPHRYTLHRARIR